MSSLSACRVARGEGEDVVADVPGLFRHLVRGDGIITDQVRFQLEALMGRLLESAAGQTVA
jgi:hypothetical protein